MNKKRIRINNVSLLIAIVLFVAMFIYGSLAFNKFGSLATIFNLFNGSAYLIVVAVGMTFVLLTGGIDISVASTVAFTSVLSAYLLRANWPAFVVIPLMLVMGLVVGYMIGYCVHVFQIQPFIISLAFQFLLRGMCAVVSRESIPITNAFYKAAALNRIKVTIGGSTAGLYYYVFVALAILIAAWFVLRFTRFGRSVYAVGSNELSAQYMGLDVRKVKISVYAINGVCAAIGGIIFSINTLAGYSLQNMGLELDAISSAVIGGTLLTGGVGTVIGTLFGVLIQGLIKTIVTYQNLNSWWTRVTIAALLCFFIVIQRIVAIRAEREKANQSA